MSDKFEIYVANAVNWATAHMGSKDYPFRCLAFVEDAYENSNRIEIFGGSSARESADDYGVLFNIERLPPLGAFVFYDCFGSLQGEYKNWGHVGLCVGHEQVVHAWNQVRLDHYLAVQQLTPTPGWTKPVFIGWAPVERILVGYRRLRGNNFDCQSS
jgi:hypothetical protein